MIRSAFVLLCMLLFGQRCIAQHHDTMITSNQAFQIAYDQDRRFVKLKDDWVTHMSYDTMYCEWKIEFIKVREIHRIGHCPQVITKKRTVWVNSRSRKVVRHEKKRYKTSDPPPYF